MRLRPIEIEARSSSEAWSAVVDADGSFGVGPIEVTAAWPRSAEGGTLTWSVAVRADHAVDLELVRAVWTVDDVAEPLRLLRNGYHSWSPTDVAVLGRDRDPSVDASLDFFCDMHHADRARADGGELRSELVTVLSDDQGPPRLAGFLGGQDHDGSFRLRRADDGSIELCAEAVFGGARLLAGERRELHPVRFHTGAGAEDLLTRWAGELGRAASARTTSPFQLGWCSWYHYFEQVTEADIRSNLGLAGDWPFDVFQVDDGYQAAIGDWLTTNDTFPSGIENLAGDIAEAGYTPGIWIAPFIAAPESDLVRRRPELLAGAPEGDDPLVNMFNDIWGGFMYGLDTTSPDTLDHLEAVGRSLVDAGYDYLKLDFTFAPKINGRFADPSRTPAQRVRAGYDAVRRGAGEEAFILGCGAPLGSLVGVVDGMRIGPDVAPRWDLEPGTDADPYGSAFPSTRGAWRSTALRAPLHRALWLNDPDCLMLRTAATELTAEQAETWARAVGVSGGMAIVSDDLSMLGSAERALLDEVVALGRSSDADAVAGAPAVSPGFLEADEPTTLVGGGSALSVDPVAGSSAVSAAVPD